MGELKKRVLAGFTIGPIIIVVFAFLPSLWLLLFLSLVALGAIYELTAMARSKDRFFLVALTAVSLVPLVQQSLRGFIAWLLFAPAMYLLGKFIRGQAREEGINGEIIRGVALLFGGMVFVVLPLYHLYLLKGVNPWLPLLLLLTLWASDTGAYFAGKTFGRRPLVPRISPKKTYEGLFGAMAGAMLVAVLSTGITSVGVLGSLLLGAAIGFLGQLGDVLESAMKRLCEVKDSSNLIPGHGGILDRIDSFIFTGPFFYFYLTGMNG